MTRVNLLSSRHPVLQSLRNGPAGEPLRELRLGEGCPGDGRHGPEQMRLMLQRENTVKRLKSL